MQKKVLITGVIGGVVLIAWMFVINGIFGFEARINMKHIQAERQVYDMLKEHIVDPGRYIFNPELIPGGPFPGGEPVFSVLYGGIGHESAGGLMLFELVLGFLATIISAWILSQASNQILSSYPRKVLFIISIGLVIAIFSDLTKFGIAGYPLKDAILLAINRIIAWTLVGLVIAWRMKSNKTNPTNA